VARVSCLPAKTKDDAGLIRLILVPLSTDAKPYPSQGLIRQVREFLEPVTRRIATADLAIYGPQYVEISISADIVPEMPEEADLVRRRVQEALTEFLHPLAGGPDRLGWAFGRDVFVSEVSKVIEETPGVHHGENVALSAGTLLGVAHIPIEEDFLVASGTHVLNMVGL